MLSGLVDDDIVYYMQRDGYSRSGAVRTYHAYVASRIKPQHRLLGRSKTKSSQLFSQHGAHLAFKVHDVFLLCLIASGQIKPSLPTRQASQAGLSEPECRWLRWP